MKGWGANPPTDDMLMTRPLCCARMWGRTALVMRMRPKTLTSKTIRSWATELSSLAPDEPMPALLTSTSMRPDRSSTSRTAPATDTSSVTSSGRNTTPPRVSPAATLRLVPYTVNPAPSSARAAALPIPPTPLSQAPPVQSRLTYATPSLVYVQAPRAPELVATVPRQRGTVPTWTQAPAATGTSSPRCAAWACSREARPDTSTIARIAPAIAIPAPARKAFWKPSVSATSAGLPAATASSVLLLATVARIARPSAPPICWDVLISPEAKPASCGSTPLTAATVIETNARPRPTAASSDGNRMSPTKLPSTRTCENQTRPAAVMSRPETSTRLKPKRVTNGALAPAVRMIPTASGRYAMPAVSAEYPRTFCM